MSLPPQQGQPYGPPPGGQPLSSGPVPAPNGPLPQGQPGAFGPPPGQPYGPSGQPFGSPAGQFGLGGSGQPYGPPPGSPVKPRKNRLAVRIVLAVVLVAVVVTGGILWATGSPDNAAVGDCLNVKEFKRGNEPDRVACTDSSANVKVAVKLDDAAGTCPRGDYDEYSVSGSYKLCLIPNDKEGDCLANFSSTTTEGYLHVDCADSKAEVKVVKVAQGIADESGCQGTEATSYRTYSEPTSTYCYQDLSQASA